MPRKTFIYRRDELYDQVWAAPMRELAKEHRISDVGLAKICKKLGVPRPGRGYWARKKAGGKAKKAPLRPLKEGERSEYRVERWVDPLDTAEFGEDVTRLLKLHEDPALAITVAKELKKPHKLVRESAGALRKHSKSQEGLRQKRACLDIKASRGGIHRALCVMDALLKALEARELRVEMTAPEDDHGSSYGRQGYTRPSKTGVHILDSFIEFGIEECVDITKIEPKNTSRSPLSPDDSWLNSPRPEYHHEPNGKLALKLKSYVLGVERQTWADGKRQRIEDCLHPFVTELILGAERERQDRVEKERRRRIREEELRRQREEERICLIEADRVQDLNDRLGIWNQSTSLLEYVCAVEDAARHRGEETSVNSGLGRWLAWARKYAHDLKQTALEDPPLVDP